MCKFTNDVVHKERERRKKDFDAKEIARIHVANDPPSPIGSEGQQSEPETMEQMNARYQHEDYWGQLYGSGTISYVNPTFVNSSTAPFMPQVPQFPPPEDDDQQ